MAKVQLCRRWPMGLPPAPAITWLPWRTGTQPCPYPAPMMSKQLTNPSCMSFFAFSFHRLDLSNLPRRFPVSSTADSTHQPPVFQCKWLGCRSSASFRRETELIRHLKTIHIAPNAYPCLEPNCGVAFGRKDHLKAHVKTHQKPSHKNCQRPRK